MGLSKRDMPQVGPLPDSSNAELLSRWSCEQKGYADRSFSYDTALTTTNLNYGCMIYNGLHPFSKDSLHKACESYVNDARIVEEIRAGQRPMAPVTFGERCENA